MKEIKCHCGKPIHYNSKEIQHMVEMLILQFGDFIPVTVLNSESPNGQDTWMVQRHYIALHGLKAKEIDTLGFKKL